MHSGKSVGRRVVGLQRRDGSFLGVSFSLIHRDALGDKSQARRVPPGAKGTDRPLYPDIKVGRGCISVLRVQYEILQTGCFNKRNVVSPGCGGWKSEI